ncbi:hypothetical protein [Paenibacillus chungangensis]|uniref:Uncharacterized protein n=1 Tax=Paenibacillus chungangensis TaxID=696535 RepID=A0ABW3HVT5_9BACL
MAGRLYASQWRSLRTGAKLQKKLRTKEQENKDLSREFIRKETALAEAGAL